MTHQELFDLLRMIDPNAQWKGHEMPTNYRTACSCGWQGLFRDQAAADAASEGHARQHHRQDDSVMIAPASPHRTKTTEESHK